MKKTVWTILVVTLLAVLMIGGAWAKPCLFYLKKNYATFCL